MKVEVTRPCMDPLSEDLKTVAAMTKLPVPDKKTGTAVIDRELLGRLKLVISGLINYVATQQAKCLSDAHAAPRP